MITKLHKPTKKINVAQGIKSGGATPSKKCGHDHVQYTPQICKNVIYVLCSKKLDILSI